MLIPSNSRWEIPSPSAPASLYASRSNNHSTYPIKFPFYSNPHTCASHILVKRSLRNNALPHRHALMIIVIFARRVAATYQPILLVLDRYE